MGRFEPNFEALVQRLAVIPLHREKRPPRITRIKRIGRNLRFVRDTRVTCRAVASREGGSAVQQFCKLFVKCGSSKT
jgi:hypothetical protein